MTAPADTLLTREGETVTGHEFHRTHVDPVAGDVPAWSIDGVPVGFAGPTLHASYLHVHWAGHPQLAQRFADAVHGCSVVEERPPARVSKPRDQVVSRRSLASLLNHRDAH